MYLRNKVYILNKLRLQKMKSYLQFKLEIDECRNNLTQTINFYFVLVIIYCLSSQVLGKDIKACCSKKQIDQYRVSQRLKF